MEIPSEEVFNVLDSKKVKSLYHANSVATACLFLRAGSLMSRGTVEKKGLYQTPQRTDKIDKEFGIWFDVFVDSVDIHNRVDKVNAYGPVLFVIDSKLIKDALTGKVWVTKLNPTKWAGVKDEGRWFQSGSELTNGFFKGRFDQMIVIRNCDGEVPLCNYLQRIILDDPEMPTSENGYYSQAYDALTLTITEAGLQAKVEKRKCPDRCSCVGSYQGDIDKTREMFFPKASK